MKPTLGSIVHYEDWFKGTCAAIVTSVAPGDSLSVHLAVFWPEGEENDTDRSLVYHRAHADFSKAPKHGTWHWPS